MADLRLVAYSIKNNRDYLTFKGKEPRWDEWTIQRGKIPRHLWRQSRWRQQHIVAPVLRERARWSAAQLSVRGVLPNG